ncbi:MAG: sodium-dependent transporter [Clostridia bacterium]|nr:sodium-dependent transporter [Clostridia bacterium]
METSKSTVEREKLGSRLGFILLSAGCAIGIGNVWKFPYMVGQNGGGAFVLVYLFFLVIFGVPILTMEFSLGRASKKSPVKMYDVLAPGDKKWKIHGYASMAGNYLLMMFYTTVAGWMIHYFVSMASGKFDGMDASAVGVEFSNVLADPVSAVVYMAIVVVVGFAVCSFSLQKGLERVTKYMMLALLVIMVVLAINSMFMDGGKEGLAFYLLPDFGKMAEIGIGNVVVSAMNQAFFTLSLGIGSMAIFGSYLGEDRSLMGESVNVAALDTFVAFCSGLIIFPACFTYGVEANSGPGLIFITLPNIFNNMPGGRIWGSFFFVFMSFAALSTVFAVFENINSCCKDMFGWSKKKACLINGIAMVILSLPCAFGSNILSGIKPFGEGTNIMDLEDFIVSNVLLPLGAFVVVVFCVSRRAWGWDSFVKEANKGKGIKVQGWMRLYMTYVLPLIVLALFVVGIINFFR